MPWTITDKQRKATQRNCELEVPLSYFRAHLLINTFINVKLANIRTNIFETNMYATFPARVLIFLPAANKRIQFARLVAPASLPPALQSQ
jgi:hypothetical protein